MKHRTISLTFALLMTAPSASSQTLPHGVEAIRIPVGNMVFDALAAGPEDGDVVLLLHGFPQAGYSYRQQLPVLAAQGFRAVAPDQRGYSPDARPPSVATTRCRISSVTCWVWPRRSAASVSTSWARLGRGGRLGGRLGRSRAGAFARRAVDPACQRVRPGAGRPGGRAGSGVRIFRDVPRGRLRAPLPRERRRTVQRDPRPVQHGRHRYDGLSGEAGHRGGAWRSAQLVSGQHGRPNPATPPPPAIVTVPTLYVWSTEDSAFARSSAEASAEFVTGPYRFEVLDGISHWIAEEAPERLSELLVAHLQEWRDR